MIIIESEDLWYRGSKSDRIDLNPEGNSNDQYGSGVYFTSKFETAQTYAYEGEVRAYEVNTSKGFFTPKSKVNKLLITKLIDYVDKNIMEIQLSNWDDDPIKAKKELISSIVTSSEDMAEAIQAFERDGCNGNREEFLSCCRATNINGLVLPNPNGMKSSEKWLVLYNFKLAHKRDLGDYDNEDN